MTGPPARSQSIKAECCFVDVGQGSCAIILLGNSKAIVIDAGPRGTTPVRYLHQHGVDEIVKLIISHNDADHVGGTLELLQAYAKRIRDVYFLEDRPTRSNVLLSVIQRQLETGNLKNQPQRLEAPSAKGGQLFSDDISGLSLHVLFPWMLANINGRERGGKNKTSAVLALVCGSRKIIFGGDAEYDQWKQLSEQIGGPIQCDILSVPHHGGLLSTDRNGDNRRDHHRWVYDNAVKCATAVVSVGSASQYDHPRPEHMEAIIDSGASIICTQVTLKCHDDLESLRPGVIDPTIPGASERGPSFTSAARRSRNVACAGSIAVEIGPATGHIKRMNEHRAARIRLSGCSGWHPLCAATLL